MKIKQLLILLSILFCSFLSVSAQNNTIVLGKIKNIKLVKKIELHVDELYINGKVSSYATTVKEDNTFAFALEIKSPQIIKMAYSRNSADIYVEPYDTLYVEIDANYFPYDLGFGGTGGFNNNLLVKYGKEFPKKSNPFEYLQYRSGIFWFHVPPDLDDMMQRMSPKSFAESMEARKARRAEYIRRYDRENEGGLTQMFKEYIEAEINYEYAYHMLCYGNIFKHKHSVNRDFFNYLLGIPLEGNQIGNFYFREYIKGYMNHLYLDLNDNNIEGIYNGEYDLAASQLEELPLVYFQSELIAKALHAKKIDIIIDKYYDFLNTNPYYEFNDKVTNAYHKVMKYHEGSQAPNFDLRTIDGDKINLKTYAGKPVFLNFWASWCRPCMKKMDKLKAFQKELEAKGVVFLNVSFDRKEDVWKETISKNNYEGVHVFLSEGTDSAIAKDYNVRAIPQFYLIDKNGKFAKGPAKATDILELKQILEKLTQ